VISARARPKTRFDQRTPHIPLECAASCTVLNPHASMDLSGYKEARRRSGSRCHLKVFLLPHQGLLIGQQWSASTPEVKPAKSETTATS
jgi:hypothetical protein